MQVTIWEQAEVFAEQFKSPYAAGMRAAPALWQFGLGRQSLDHVVLGHFCTLGAGLHGSLNRSLDTKFR